MSQSLVVKSFANLPELLQHDQPREEPTEAHSADPLVTSDDGAAAPDLASLLAELEAAGAALATIARQDQEVRSIALRDLERYDGLIGQQREAERAAQRAQQVGREAETLAETAFTEEARAAAQRVARLADQAEAAAALIADQRRAAAESLAARLDLDRLLAERRREEEAGKARAAAAERAGRLSGALAGAEAALRAGRFEEAKALLGSAGKENPENADVASLLNMIVERELAVKTTAAEEALWTVRREYRREPAQAVERLAALDLTGLPELLTRQIFGAWARACARLCRERGLTEPLRYAPEPGRGVIIAREHAAAPYTVVSALGMDPTWQVGSPISEREVRRARPLRAD